MTPLAPLGGELAAASGGAELGTVTRALGLEVPSGGVRWTGWTPARRRSGPGGPSDEVLYHLRGTKNAVFKVA